MSILSLIEDKIPNFRRYNYIVAQSGGCIVRDREIILKDLKELLCRHPVSTIIIQGFGNSLCPTYKYRSGTIVCHRKKKNMQSEVAFKPGRYARHMYQFIKEVQTLKNNVSFFVLPVFPRLLSKCKSTCKFCCAVSLNTFTSSTYLLRDKVQSFPICLLYIGDFLRNLKDINRTSLGKAADTQIFYEQFISFDKIHLNRLGKENVVDTILFYLNQFESESSN